jgi:hypothetical protein
MNAKTVRLLAYADTIEDALQHMFVKIRRTIRNEPSKPHGIPVRVAVPKSWVGHPGSDDCADDCIEHETCR